MAWTQILDNRYWTPVSNVTWDDANNRWSVTGAVEARLDVKGNWANGYRPKRMRLTISGITSIALELFCAGFSELDFTYNNLYRNGEVLDCIVSISYDPSGGDSDYDMDRLYLYGVSGFYIENIAFSDRISFYFYAF